MSLHLKHVAFSLLLITLQANPVVAAAIGNVAPSTQSSNTAMRLAIELKAPIEQGLLEVEAVDRYILIRILEKNAFAPDAATLRPAYLPVLATLRTALKNQSGDYTVAGYTDDVAINTAKYRSNWEFAAARASAVIVELLKTAELPPGRFTLVSYGATRPLLLNTNAENRARNRRVEIVIQQ